MVGKKVIRTGTITYIRPESQHAWAMIKRWREDHRLEGLTGKQMARYNRRRERELAQRFEDLELELMVAKLDEQEARRKAH